MSNLTQEECFDQLNKRDVKKNCIEEATFAFKSEWPSSRCLSMGQT